MVTSTDLGALAGVLRVLANEKRLQVLRLLAEPRSVDSVAQALGVTRQAAWRHVHLLEGLGLVERRRGRASTGPAAEFALVLPRLFTLQEGFAQLGRIDPNTDENLDFRTVLDSAALPGPTPLTDAVARLEIVYGMRIGQVMRLDGSGPWLVGRDPSADLCLDYDPYVSTRHAEVFRRETAYWLRDLYSANETVVDGRTLPPGEAVPLASAAIVGIGHTRLVFRC